MSEENLYTFENEAYRKTYWHTCSHIMAQAVKRLWPEVKLAIGPSIDLGWYYDFDAPFSFTNEHLEQDLDYDYLPDFVKLAEAHGAEAYRVIDPAKLDATIAKAVKSKKTTVVEVIVEPRANVYPMIPAGKPVSEMVFD